MSTQKGNQKHLTLSDRINIEKGLNNSDSFAAIARAVHKDPTTISKEVRKHSRNTSATRTAYTCSHTISSL